MDGITYQYPWLKYVIRELLSLIYEKSMMTGTIGESQRSSSTQKESRQIKKNYRLISLLPICGKIFEKLIFDATYEHLTDNQLLTPNQAGFRQGDSTINQLLYITHRIYAAFEEFPSRENCDVFLDLSKAFD